MSSRTLHTIAAELGSRGDRTALLALTDEGIDTWSSVRLAERAQAFERRLRACGVAPGARVALFADDGPDWVAACLAVWRAGASAVPVDVQLDDALLAHVIEDSGVRAVFTTRNREGRIPQPEHGEAPAKLVVGDSNDESADGNRPETADDPRSPEDEAVLFYTSGTTGRPKGVPLHHADLLFQLDALRDLDFIHEDDRVLLPLPLHHVYPFVMGMLAPLSLGIAVVLPGALTGPRLLRAIHETEPTIIIGVPRLYRALLDGIDERVASMPAPVAAASRAAMRISTWARRRHGLRLGRRLLRPLHERFGPKLRLVASGGAALPAETAWRLEGLGWRVMSGYGLTETAPLVALNPPGSDRLEAAGRALPGVEIRIAANEHEQEADGGEDEASDGDGRANVDESPEVGEILVRGPNVFEGYLHLPDETRKAFNQDGWFRTGDRGYLDEDGFLHVLGRSSTLIVTEGGKNVDPEEVESAYEESDVIREIAVIEREGKLVGIVVPDARNAPQSIEEAVDEAVRARSRSLPSYQRLGDFALTRERLPRTRLGKLRRHLLAERYERATREDEAPSDAPAEPIAIEHMEGDDRALLDDPAARGAWEYLGERYADRRLTPDSSLQLDLEVDSMEWLNINLGIQERTGVALDDDAIARIEIVRDLLTAVAEAGGEAGERAADWLADPQAMLDEEKRRWLAPSGAFSRAAARALYALDWSLMRGVYRLRVRGREHLPEPGEQVMLIANHASYLDPFALAAALGHARVRDTYWGGWVGVAFDNPLVRRFSRLARIIPIDPHKGVMTSLAFAAAVLERGHCLMWFPEGRRSADGKLQAFRAGVGTLLRRFPVPVVPARIEGTHEIWPPDRRLPRAPRRITVTFGPRIGAGELLAEAGDDDREAPQRIAAALHHRFVGVFDDD